jgi:hypothetical protein
MNYGWLGIVLSALVVGLVLRLIWRTWIGDSNALGNVMIGMAVMATAVDQESSLGLWLGGVVHALVIYAVLAYLLCHAEWFQSRREGVPSQESRFDLALNIAQRDEPQRTPPQD